MSPARTSITHCPSVTWRDQSGPRLIQKTESDPVSPVLLGSTSTLQIDVAPPRLDRDDTVAV